MAQATTVVVQYETSLFPLWRIVPIAHEADYDAVGDDGPRLSASDAAAYVEALGSVRAMPRGLPQILAVRAWVRATVPRVGVEQLGWPVDDPGRLLRRAPGRETLCRNLAIIQTAALRSLGYRARVVQLARDLTPGTFATHVTGEVYDSSHAKWIVSDPTYNALFTDSTGTPLNAREIQSSVKKGLSARLRVERSGATTSPDIAGSGADFWPVFQHVFILVRPSFSVIDGKLTGRAYYAALDPNDGASAVARRALGFAFGATVIAPMLLIGSFGRPKLSLVRRSSQPAERGGVSIPPHVRTPASTRIEHRGKRSVSSE